MPYLFTSESVSEGHPDKVADQISDAILDEFLKHDPQSKVACETLVTTGLVVLSGEVKSEAYIDVQQVARNVIKKIGYTKSEYMFEGDSCGVISALHEQSGDINQGVERENPEEQGAGDQGMMFGYATNETDNYMPLALGISHLLLQELADIRREGKEMTYLRPDAKSQVTIRYSDENVPEKIDTIVISTQHDEFEKASDDSRQSKKAAEDKMLNVIREDIQKVLVPRVKAKLPERIQNLFDSDINYHINPTGKFVIGGPHGDTGLTGRKIIVDTYGGKGAHGGGAFSGKDSSKVDRSAAYATRHIAKNLVAAGVADQALVQVAYAIGVADPVGLYVTTYGTTRVKDSNGNTMSDGEIAERVSKLFDMRPYGIVKRFGLQNPIFAETAAYGHMGRTPGKKTVTVKQNGQQVEKEFETFTWEKLDYVDKIKEAFGL
ncbi:MAG: methionine adenosyltransferase [Hymenobacteraceae bacterium]|nr:methionine adenosyltransferase [Hymenobacteraceae bacterium]MDX5397208.1 methionine adenosyltransferase [Hymenobacteraceae bacterium]MDX5442926.1 methionine adenosyltransferase [Hymenobacteraceae bacterium]MDX5513284.1 methionine adenosyltransferase [Hymenobacteraceae bacterium]